MKNLLCFIGLMLFAFPAVFAQTPEYVQWELMYITPKPDKIDLFKKGVAAHNKKYHPAGAYHVSVWSVINGPNSGDYIWLMGPTNWTQMDGRPGAGEHQADWDKNVGPYVDKYGEVSYWRRSDQVNYTPEGATGLTKQRSRFYEVKSGQMDRFEEQMKKIAEVYKQKKYTAGYALYQRYGATKGSEAATGLSFSKWAYFDSGTNFVKDYEEIHGAGSWQRFNEEMDLCLDRSETFDELIELAPDLGG